LAWPEGLAGQLDGMASVTDQSAGYSVLRIKGAKARKLLQAGAHLDLHPSRFSAGSSASTVIGHIGVVVWQVDAVPTFDIALYRSYAASLQHWIDATVPAL